MTAERPTVTVATYNIRAAIGPGPFPAAWWRASDPARLERIGRLIGDLDADVVSLQEVAVATVAGRLTDQSAVLAGLAGLEARYAATGHFPVTEPESGRAIGASFWGNAILSRLPIIETRAIGLPAAPDDELVEPPSSNHELAGVRYADAPIGVRESRCALRVTLMGPAGPFHVVATHLAHIGSGQRRRQAAAIAELIAGLDGPVVVAGDLNAPIEATELEPLASRLVDAFAAGGIPAGDPRRESCGMDRIDHVLVRAVTPRSCRVVVEAGDASDHWPVVAVLET